MTKKIIFILLLFKITVNIIATDIPLSQMTSFLNNSNVYSYYISLFKSSNNKDKLRANILVSYNVDKNLIKDFVNDIKKNNTDIEISINIYKSFFLNLPQPDKYYTINDKSGEINWEFPVIISDFNLKPIIQNNKIALRIPIDIDQSKITKMKTQIETVLNIKISDTIIDKVNINDISSMEDKLNIYTKTISSESYMHWNMTSRINSRQIRNSIELVFELKDDLIDYDKLEREIYEITNCSNISFIKEVELNNITKKPHEEIGPAFIKGIQSIISSDNYVKLNFDAKLSSNEIFEIRDEWINQYSIK